MSSFSDFYSEAELWSPELMHVLPLFSESWIELILLPPSKKWFDFITARPLLACSNCNSQPYVKIPKYPIQHIKISTLSMGIGLAY